jgi:HEAT repeat protein
MEGDHVMFTPRYLLWLGSIVVAAVLSSGRAESADMPPEEAWNVLPQYTYGDDLGVLLSIDRAVIEAMATPESRSACAARLAELLVQEHTTLPARQYICLQLRQIGTAAEVPVLARLLSAPETTEMARMALQAIPGEEATEALCEGLTILGGPHLIGVIQAVAARKAKGAVSRLLVLSDAADPDVVAAALWGLGEIAEDQAAAFLTARATEAGVPTPLELAVPLLRCAQHHETAGSGQAAQAIYRQLSQAGQPRGVRRGALEGQLRMLDPQARQDMVLDWFTGTDADCALLAAGHLRSLPDAQLDQMLTHLAELPAGRQLAVIELAATRRGQMALPLVLSMVASENSAQKLAAVRCLGVIGDVSAMTTLLDLLNEEPAVSAAAQHALLQLPREDTVAALLAALQQRPEIRAPVIEILVELHCYDAIDPLIELASHNDATQYDAALGGLRRIADPDRTDIPRLVRLLLKTEPGRHRDEVEKTILLVTAKLPPEADRSQLVREALSEVPDSEVSTYLPLLGRLGGSISLAMIRSALEHADAGVREAAVRALCNWPDAEVAEQLLELAQESPERAFRRSALRAYVRVVTLPHDRPDAETLTLLQQAMALASEVDDQRLILNRTATVRTLDSAHWIASYLDDMQLREAACAAVVELAHHRFLREPNKRDFDVLLEKIARVSQNQTIVERAQRYRLGL